MSRKWSIISLVIIPMLMVLYFTIGVFWDLSNVKEVLGTLAFLDAFAGIFLYVLSMTKVDGTCIVTTNDEGGKTYLLELESDPYDLDMKTEVIFRVRK